jgi:hypothetical protein
MARATKDRRFDGLECPEVAEGVDGEQLEANLHALIRDSD